MKKEFITYEQALQMKELGYAEPSSFYWAHEIITLGFPITNYLESKWVAAPLYQQSFRWFREKYKLHSYIYSDYSWNISGGIWDLNGYKDSRYDWDSDTYPTYEEAEQACLNKLIEIVKNAK